MSDRQIREAIVGALEGYQATALATMAQRLGLTGPGRKQALVDALATRLTASGGLAAQLAALTDSQRETLAYVTRQGSLIPVRQLLNYLRRLTGAATTAEQQLIDLLQAGMLLFAPRGGGWRLDISSADPAFASQMVWSPPAVQEEIQAFDRWEPLLVPASPPSRIVAGDVGPLLRDLYVALRWLKANPVRLTQQQLPHQSDLRKFTLAIRPHVEAKAWQTMAGESEFVLRLLGFAGLVVVESQSLMAAPTVEAALAGSRPALIGQLYQAWLMLPWSELARVPTLIVEEYGQVNGLPLEGERSFARLMISELLLAIAAGGWWSVASLSQALQRREPEFLVPEIDPSPLLYLGLINERWAPQPSPHYRGIRRRGGDLRASQILREGGWEEVEGAYLRQVLREPLSWLGLVDCGLTENGQVEAVRLTPLGRAVLSGQPLAPAPTARGTRLVVQPNFELIVLDVATSFDLMARLDAFARPRSADRAAIYHLERAVFLEALQRGQDFAGIVELLERESGSGLPQNVRFTLDQWCRQFNRVSLTREAVVIEADSPEQLASWQRLPSIGRYLSRQLGPTTALVAPEHLAAVQASLARSGPLMIEDCGRPSASGLLLQGTSRLAVRPESLGRFERHRLMGFADQVEANQAAVIFEVTAASGARARAAGWTAPLVLGWLGQRLGRPVPDGLAVAIRGWLGDLPPACQTVIRLVKLPDPIVWTILAPLAEAGLLLQRIAPTLVLADEAGLARIGQALAERGVALEAALPATVATGWPGESGATPVAGLDLAGLQPLRGKALRDFLAGPIADGRRVLLLYQAPNQKVPKRHSVLPTRIDHRYMGYYLVAETPQQTVRSFKLDDVLAVAVEEGS